MIDICCDDRDVNVTVIAFSGIAVQNHIYEWAASFSDFPVNLVGVRDPHKCWYQRDTEELVDGLTAKVKALGGSWLVCLGGSSGGFAALKFGRDLRADRVLAFVPQSACGPIKRALGDCRWPNECWETPSDDIAGWHGGAIVHYASDEVLDEMHARRLLGADLREWDIGRHALPHRLKEAGKLRGLLDEVMP